MATRSGSLSEGDAGANRLVWVMVVAMLISFSFGVAMFLPEDHRAQKLEETMAKYLARKPGH